MIANIMVQVGDWDSFKQHLVPIREVVFIQEQQVPVALEWDEYDQTAIHLLVQDANEVGIACARLMINTIPPDNKHKKFAKLGRMAVKQSHRRQGLGSMLLNKALAIAISENQHSMRLSAQMQAVPFYEKAGFQIDSKPYLDANIWHMDMIKPL
jgi:predicted GNAT family N-acyltransferase